MRFLEIGIFVSLGVALIAPLVSVQKRRWLFLPPVTVSFFLAAHLLFEGYRWQMVPIYILAGLSVLWGAWRANSICRGRSTSNGWQRVSRFSVRFLVIAIYLAVALPPNLLPVFRLPNPSGYFEVGTNTLYFVDPDRIDEFSGEGRRQRQFSVRAWYPVAPGTGGQPTPYMRKEAAEAMACVLELPRFFLTHFSLVPTHSILEAQPSNQRSPYPVVFYSPSGQISQNTALCEELASHGYVVFSVAHPYWNAFHYDENGKVVPLDVNNAYFNALWEEERSSAAAAAKEKITISADREAREEAFRELNAQMPLEVADLRLWGEDLTFLLTELGQLNQNGGRWHGMFDLERVGAVGFSKGGAAAGQFCISDPRCRAGVNLSGFMFGDIVEKSLPCPFLFLENYEDWCEECAPINTLFEDTAEAITYTVRIRNAKHGNFSDWSLVGKFLQLIDVIGPIDGHRFLKIQNEYVRGFFDKHLKGLPVPILESPPTSDPDVVFRARSATIDPSTPIS